MERVRVPIGKQSEGNLEQLLESHVPDFLTGYAITNALFALVESNLHEQIKDGVLAPAAAARRAGLEPRFAEGLAKYLSLHGLFVEEGENFRLTPAGRKALSRPALEELLFYRGGYGRVMFEAPALLRKEKSYGRDLVRDGKYVAYGSSECFRLFYAEPAFAAVERCQGKRVLDMGCGDASFLIDLCTRVPDATGIGIDIDEASIVSAREAIAKAGLSKRIRVLQGDAFALDVLAPLAREVDVLYSFALQHEMLRDGEKAVIDHLDKMARVFAGKWYVLGEPMLDVTRDDSLFYWIHNLSLQGMPRNVDGWLPLFARCKARVEAIFQPAHGQFAAFFLLRL